MDSFEMHLTNELCDKGEYNDSKNEIANILLGSKYIYMYVCECS